MRIERPGRLSRPIPLTPLIDVVFLLLMFFMLSTTFAKFGLFGVGAAAATQADPAATQAQTGQPGVLIEVRHGPRVRVNGFQVGLADLPAKLNAFQRLGADLAVLRPAGGADVQDLVTVLEAARQSRLRAIALAK